MKKFDAKKFDEDWISKDSLIATIQEYEKTGIRNAEFSFSAMIERIENECLDDIQKNHMRSIFIYKVKNQYHALKNIYKDGLEKFNRENEIGEKDRIDFIASCMLKYYSLDTDQLQKTRKKLEFANDVRIFGVIIPETYELWLLNRRLVKIPYLNSTLNSEIIETKEHTLSALETAYLAYYFVQTGEYKLNDHIGNEKDWKHFSEIAGGSSITNVRKNFKEIERHKDIRLKSSRDRKIKNTLIFIENKFPEKKKRDYGS